MIWRRRALSRSLALRLNRQPSRDIRHLGGASRVLQTRGSGSVRARNFSRDAVGLDRVGRIRDLLGLGLRLWAQRGRDGGVGVALCDVRGDALGLGVGLGLGRGAVLVFRDVRGHDYDALLGPGLGDGDVGRVCLDVLD